MAYFRDNAPVGQTVTLRATFRDGAGNLIDVDAGYPDIYIYDEETTAETIDAAVAADNFSGASYTIESASVTKISTGFYEASWAVGAAYDTGSWSDLWVAKIGGVTVTSHFVINVVSVGSVTTQTISNNMLIVVTIDSSVAGASGNALSEETHMTFSTTYSPYYASPDLVRLECGSWLDSIPDDTLSLMIHWASLEADMIAVGGSSGSLLTNGRTKFVIYDCALRCLTIPINMGGRTKQLGDLMIRNDSTFVEVVSELKRKREEWFSVVNARGSIVPGQGLGPTSAIKGRYDPDRVRQGRTWHSPKDFPYAQPGANTRLRRSDQRKYKKGFLDRGPDEIILSSEFDD